MINICWRKHCL